ncbi:glycosyltransferase family 4 protein [Umezakia ovalisporum]|jgi:glycosyltransferase involved in cell wall biosynthesis|uniref:Glycosyltransferase family 4 protein n=2 Tax=Umezakia ovalisporum TaxID=75695 RepID=A0AA43KG24_9CYAN|nr:glycosyltransferase family 4 protein [Umezakia ovalisporum]MDH6057170.1 glycosyltransferase family 4 protein [Umezakia ovalisporum FSS-43]MDH6064618.1 glycosyltransferase family 4 protein [Umezakia ovalisporum FSS-62]MDH6069020.1 glycosyltransferase family 4 protein [Umezakia ovalisporum APH033B]MDH6071710.1 glycosyltransferase family 4 protein [Umezakia ovalisporum CobakiLakeA]MDH6073402.1 glycosyltransferase family 4 protein [Umezakia ovalisporum CS-1034]
MKICIVTHTVKKGDGQGRVNYEVVQQAIHRGYHLTLLASEVDLELQQNHQVNWVPISIKGWPTEFIRNMIFAIKSTNWLQKHRHELDIVKVNGAITNAPGNVNAVHFVHNSWLKFTSQKTQPRSGKFLYNFYQWLYTTLNAYWEKQAFRKAQVVVAVSHQVAQDLLEIGVAEKSLKVILNGVDLQEFSPGTSNREKWQLPEGVPLALFAGDITLPRKNLDTVLKALVSVPELHLAVAGNTQRSPYVQLATSLGLSERVHFLGQRSDVPELMKSVDFLVFPSRYEPFGLVIIEAMASGLPVITASSTGAAHLVTPESGIVLSDSDDVEALTQALQLLTSHRSLRQQMGKAARSVAEQHSWTNMAQTYVNLFEELINYEKYSSHPHLSPSSGSITLPFGTASTN